MIGVGCAFGLILLTQSAWATDTALTEEFRAEWQDAQDSLTGKWIKVKVYDKRPYENQYWRKCELIVEPGGIIKGGKYVELNGDTTKITGGKLVQVPGVAIVGKLETGNGDLYVERGGIFGTEMVLGLYGGTIDKLVQEDMESDLQMLSTSTSNLEAKSVRSFLSKHRVSVDRAFPNMTLEP